MHKRRLLWQLYPTYLVITLISLAVVTWYASSSLRQFYLDQTDADLQSRAWLVGEQFVPLLARRDDARIDALCKSLGTKAATRITVILPDGKVVGDTAQAPGAMENHADRPEVIDALAGGSGAALHQSRTLHETWRYVAVALREEGTAIGVVRTSLSLAAIDRTLAGIRLHIVLGSLAVAALLALVSLTISRRIARPLEQLKHGAERFAHGDLAYRLPIADSLEAGSLAETLNHMAADLDEKIHAVVRQRNEREAILASMIEGVLAVDADEHVTRLNQAAMRLLGIEPGRAEGRTIQELVRNADLDRLVASVLSAREPAQGEITIRGGPDRCLLVQGSVLSATRSGGPGVLLVLHDVTEMKKLERMRQDFVANVSHELRTPVTSIKGFVETLLDGAMHNPDELSRFLHVVAAQTDRLNAIIEDLLTLSRVEQDAERAEIVLAPGSVRDVLQGAMEVCAIKADEKNVRVELTCDAGLQAPMNAPLLEQAVINLIDNAVKYSNPEQTIHVEAVLGQSEVLIRVRDQGCGIGREHLPRIFERFYRVDKARSRKLGGTGLGLAIVKHIAQSHGGRATVESTPGQGSAFSIHLPFARG